MTADDLPHTVTYAILYRMRIDSFSELPKEKRPPRDLWSKPYKLEQFFDEIFEPGASERTKFIDFNEEDVE